jgi:predicted permease
MRKELNELGQDIRFSWRQTRRSPGFAAAATLTLAAGIGANSAVFSVLNGVLLEPLPYAAADELQTVHTAFPTMGFDEFWLSPPEYFELREWNRSFENLGAYRVGAASVETLDRPLRVVSSVATWTFFPTLGVSAVHGRTFLEEEDRMGAEPTVVLSHSLWERGFGSDPEVVGSTIRVSGQSAVIIGVLPEGFDIDDAGVEIWRPLNLIQAVDPNDHVERRGNHFMNVVGRLRPGVTQAMLQEDLEGVMRRSEEEYGGAHPLTPEGHPIYASDLAGELFGDVRSALILLMGAVSFVLLIACANVANLLLARSEGRAGEVAVRVAMGSDRGRMTRQLLTEGLMLALAGAALGLLLAHVGTGLLLGVNPEAVPRAGGIGVDGRVVAFTALVAVATGVLFGLAPLLATTMRRVGATLKEGGTRSTRGSAGARARKTLVVAEVAFAMVLLVGSGLMIRSVAALRDVDLGFDAESVLTLTIALPAGDYPEPERVGAFFADLLSRVRALPGVAAASATSGLPPTQPLVANDTEFEGFAPTPDGPAQNVDFYTGVDDGYFEAMRVAVVEGRSFEPADALAETPVLLVNERVAETFYPGQSPVGRRVRPGGSGDLWFTVIGVVADVKQAGVSAPSGTEIFFYNPQVAEAGGNVYRARTLVIRAQGDPLALAPTVERIVRDIDPALPVADVRTLEQNVRGSIAQPRFLTLLLGVFAGVALLLASVGTYSVMSYSVAERTREMGIRMAIGAEPGRVQALVLRQGVLLTAVGLALGLAGAFALTRFLASQLYDVGATDPRTFVAVPLLLGAVAVLACYIPARRATRIDPVEALREAYAAGVAE